MRPRIWFNSLSKYNATGYGGAGDSFISELHRLQWPMVVGSITKHIVNSVMSLDWKQISHEFRPDVQIDFLQPYRGYETDFLTSPHTGNSWRAAPLRFLFTMFESRELPFYLKGDIEPFGDVRKGVQVENWADDINNRYDYDALIVPSEWCAQIFRDNGVKIPIHVVPLGVDTHKFPYLDRPVDRSRFTFLHQCFYLDDRKGGDLAIDAFKNLKEKGELKDARMILKWVPFITKCIDQMNIGYWEDLYGLNNNLPQGELLDLLGLADFSVNPTSGEGFGLIPLEHMATGLPVAVSNNTGCKDYVNDMVNFPIDCFEQPNWFTQIGGMELRPDPEHVEALMLYAYNNREEMQAKGRLAAQYVRDNWTYEHATDKLLNVIASYHDITEFKSDQHPGTVKESWRLKELAK